MNITYTAFKKCIKTKSELTRSIYHNICNGNESVVHNGFWDYFLSFSFSAILLAVCVILSGIAYRLFTD